MGATEGPPVTCNWTTAGVVPRLLPWLAILALLALKPNRGWSAWWIWVPLAGVAGGYHWLQPALQGSPADRSGEAIGMLLQVPVALGFSLAALWLLAPYLGERHRLRTCLGILTVLVSFILFSFAATAGWGLVVEPLASLLDPRHAAATASVGVMALPFLVPLALPAPGLAAAMVLSGLACRGCRHPFVLCLWLFMSLLAVWVAVSALLYVLWRIASPGGAEYAPFLGIGLLIVAVTIATLLPFLVLSVMSPFFCGRLKALLCVRPEAPAGIEARRRDGRALQFDRPGTGIDSVPGC